MPDEVVSNSSGESATAAIRHDQAYAYTFLTRKGRKTTTTKALKIGKASTSAALQTTKFTLHAVRIRSSHNIGWRAIFWVQFVNWRNHSILIYSWQLWLDLIAYKHGKKIWRYLGNINFDKNVDKKYHVLTIIKVLQKKEANTETNLCITNLIKIKDKCYKDAWQTAFSQVSMISFWVLCKNFWNCHDMIWTWCQIWFTKQYFWFWISTTVNFLSLNAWAGFIYYSSKKTTFLNIAMSYLQSSTYFS